MIVKEFLSTLSIFTIVGTIVLIVLTAVNAVDEEVWEDVTSDCKVFTELEYELWFKSGPALVSETKTIYCKSELVEKK